jgi:hypothetical protein
MKTKGNGTRQLLEEKKRLCSEPHQTSLLILANDGTVYDDSEDICELHNGKLLDSSLSESDTQLLQENLQILKNCPFWAKRQTSPPNDTKIPSTKDNRDCSYFEYNTTSDSFEIIKSADCYYSRCIVCSLPVAKRIFKIRTHNDKFYDESNVFLHYYNYDQMLYLETNGEMWIKRDSYLWKVSTMQYASNGSMTPTEEAVIEGGFYLFGIVNLTFTTKGPTSYEKSTLSTLEVKITNVSKCFKIN